MTNFDFLKSDAQFSAFADAAIAAERVYQIDVPTCVLNCRRAMEFAVKWMYSVDEGLVMPYQDNLVSLMNTREFLDLLDDRNRWRRMDSIRRHRFRSSSRSRNSLVFIRLTRLSW